MNRVIYNTMKNHRNIKNMANLNKWNSIKETPNCFNNPFNVKRRHFSGFYNFPTPPEDPNHLFFMCVALSIAYLISKKF